MRLLVRSSALLLLVFGTGAGFFSNPAKVTTLTVPSAWDVTDLGVMWSDDFNRASLGTNWFVGGGASASISGNELLIASGGGEVFYPSWMISSDSWTIRWKQRFNSLNSTSYGVGVGLKNMQVYGGNDRAYNVIFYGAGPRLGQCVMSQVRNNGQNIVTNGAAISFAAGDVLECFLTRKGWDMTAVVSNRANGLVSTCAFTYSIPVLHESPTISVVCVYAEGGSVAVDDVSFSINRRKPARFVCIGDSVSDGFNISSYAAEYRSVIESNYTQAVCNESSSYNVTSNSLSILPEILAHKPQTAILMIGGNDLFLNVPATQWKLQYTNLVGQLQASGVTVKHCLPNPRNNIDLRQLKIFISTNYPASSVIDLWTPLLSGVSLLNSIYDSGDGVHPNDAGHLLMGSIIRTNLP